MGRPVEAERHLHRAVEVLAARWGDADSRVDAARIPLGEALVAQGRADEAAALLRPVVERLDETPDPGDEMARRAREALARAERPRTD